MTASLHIAATHRLEFESATPRRMAHDSITYAILIFKTLALILELTLSQYRIPLKFQHIH